MNAFETERLRDAERRIRDGIVAFAAYLAGRGTSEQVIAALCPADTDPAVRSSAFLDLLHLIDVRDQDHTDLPWEAQVDLNQMTGI